MLDRATMLGRMRVLFTSLVSPGHLRPMVPLAWALRADGHDVAVASAPNMTRWAHSVGLWAVPFGEIVDPIASMRKRMPKDAKAYVDQFQGRPSPDRHRATGRRLGALAGRNVDELLTFARSWRPDVVVYEPMELTGRVVAAVLGVPSVQHRWGVEHLDAYNEGAAEGLAETCSRFGLDDVSPSVIIDPCPASLQLPDVRPGWPMRYVPFNGAADVPAWVLEPPTRSRVCVTFGNDSLQLGSAGTLTATLTALGDFDVDVLATVPAQYQSMFPSLPSNVELIDSVPIGMFLPSCDLVVHHGGSGSSFSALDAGCPQLVMAQPDGFDYGDAIERAGAGHLLEFAEEQRDSAVIASRIGKILGQATYRDAAVALAEESRRRPSPAAVAARLTSFVAEAV